MDDYEWSREDLETFATSDGRELHLRPVSTFLQEKNRQRLIDEYESRGESLDAPRGEIHTAAGTIEYYPLTPDNLERPHDPEGTERNKAVWAAYHDTWRRFAAEQGESHNALLLAVGVEDVEEEEGWEQEYEWATGEAPPKSGMERKIAYLRARVLPAPEDVVQVLSRIQLLSAGKTVGKEGIKAVEAIFQHSLRPRRQVYAPGRSAAGKEPVETQQRVPGDDDGAEVGRDPEPVGPTERAG